MPRLPRISPKALAPTFFSLISFILIILLMAIGSSPSWQPFALISIDTTSLKVAYYTVTGAGLPIHDAYSLHLQTTCESYLFEMQESRRFVSVSCMEKGTDVKFEPLTLIQNDLTTHFSRHTVQSLRIPAAIQEIFTKRYNAILHIAFIIYVFAITSTGIGFLLGGAAAMDVNVPGKEGILGLGSAALSTILLFVASIMTTVIQSNATSLINAVGAPIGISAFHGSGFMALTWCSCVASLLAAGAWLAVVQR
ncbi:hypothetical protein ONS95_002534 [Cadophora gregata]|uniref:uncharacterized protein n=1 Tax=Cadophora gregata TaxID=51156 RepID=UPI0026DA99E3|nr:uncharacterized protein ONS95_002534 [Cadophora gregata]KAK0109863.1 hypothetical protein ONS95_002534 [Cadophora gregata]KAK0110510.1 hypothetical protein ONS96_002119 [Cadophora gregata f. sp. sojae]